MFASRPFVGPAQSRRWRLLVLAALLLPLLVATVKPAGALPAPPGPDPDAVPAISVSPHACSMAGYISADTTWSPAGCNPYIISGNVLVSPGTTLTILPGTTIKFDAGKSLQIGGTLVARGQAGSLISFTSNTTLTAGAWGYILFKNTSAGARYDVRGNYLSGSIVQYASIKYGGGAALPDNGALRIDTATPFIDHTTIANSAADGVHAYNGATPRITYCTVSRNAGTGISATGVAPQGVTHELAYNTIDHNRGGGINAASNASLRIHHNTVTANTGAISGGGIWVDYAAQNANTISDNIVRDNSAAAYGGGIGLGAPYGPTSIAHNTVIGNSSGEGGGIYLGDHCAVELAGNVVVGNSAVADPIRGYPGNGGGIYEAYWGIAHIHSNIIAGNTADGGTGGGYWGEGTLDHNSILANQANNDAAVHLVLYTSTSASFSANTIVGNVVLAPNEQRAIYLNDTARPEMTANNIYGNSGYALWNGNLQASGDVDATGNWWGTADLAGIQELIYDWVARDALSVVNVAPYLSAPDPEAPLAPPTNLQGVRDGTSAVLAWSANAESDLAGYKVYWATAKGYPYAHVVDAGNVTQYTLDGLPGGTPIYVAVTAYDTDVTGTDDQTMGHESWFAEYDFPNPNPIVHAVTPKTTPANKPVAVTITGENFSPTPAVHLGGYTLQGVTYVDPLTLRATVPANLAPGVYDLTVVNPDGKSGTLSKAFTVLLPPPQLVRVLPQQGRGDVPSDIHLWGLNFTANTSVMLEAAPPESLVSQPVVAGHLRSTVPAGMPPGSYGLTLANPGSSAATFPNSYTVIPPEIGDLLGYDYELWSDPLALITHQTVKVGLVVHRQGGSAPLTDVTVRFYVGDPRSGGHLLGNATIPVLPADSSGSTSFLNWTTPVTGTYLLYAMIDPDNKITEARKDNDVVTRTVTVYPPRADLRPPSVDGLTANGGALTTSSVTVTLDMMATDPAPGSGLAELLFVEHEYSQAASQWVPVQTSGWLALGPAGAHLPWALTTAPGVHYIQAWAADVAGNISRAPGNAYINYLPGADNMVRGQVRVYRYNLSPGQAFTARAVPAGGDVDLYVWRPDSTLAAKSVQLGKATEQVSISAPITGVYQVEVFAVDTSRYSLSIAGAAFEGSVAQAGQQNALLRDRPLMLTGDRPEHYTPPSVQPGKSFYYVYLPMLRR